VVAVNHGQNGERNIFSNTFDIFYETLHEADCLISGFKSMCANKQLKYESGKGHAVRSSASNKRDEM